MSTTIKFEVEPIIRLHDDDGAYLEVGSDPDVPDFVQVRTPTKASADYFGEVRLTLSPEKAKQLSAALLSIVEQLELNPI